MPKIRIFIYLFEKTSLITYLTPYTILIPSVMNKHRIANSGNTTGLTRGAGTVYHEYMSSHWFSMVGGASSLIFLHYYVLLSLCSFWPL